MNEYDELFERYCDFLGDLDGEAWYTFEDWYDIFVEKSDNVNNRTMYCGGIK